MMAEGSDPHHVSLISQFSNITGADVERSRFYLEAAGWDLSVITVEYVENVAISVCVCIIIDLYNYIDACSYLHLASTLVSSRRWPPVRSMKKVGRRERQGEGKEGHQYRRQGNQAVGR